MNLLPGPQRVTSDAQVGTAGKPIRVFYVELVSSSTASTLSLEAGSGSGSAWSQIDGVASQSVSRSYPGGLLFPSGCYAECDANISYATIIYTEER